MTDPIDIEAMELASVHIPLDGRRVRLRVRDQSGRTVRFTLPANWLSSMVNALPDLAATVWCIRSIAGGLNGRLTGQDLVLTLQTPEAKAVSFAMKRWQVEGMATIATYGNVAGTTQQTLH